MTSVTRLGEFGNASNPIVESITSAGALVEVCRIQAGGRAVSLRIEVQADGSNVDSITDMKITSAAVQDGDHDPLFAGSDFQTPDVDIPSISILNASAAAITNFPTTAVPETGVIRMRIEAGAAEYSLWLKGVATVEISGMVR